MIALAWAWVVLCFQDAPYEAALEALRAGRFGEAWTRLEAVEDPVARRRGRAEALYSAGDASGALAEVRAGLEVAPEDLELLFRGAATCNWLEDPAGSAEYARRLEQAVAAAELSPDERAAWEAAVRTFHERARGLSTREERRRAAVTRARGVSLAALFAAAALLFHLGRPG